MAKEIKILEIIQNAGFNPIENQAIIVSYAAPNLSAKIANFFYNEFFVLQICKDALVLVPFGKLSLTLKKEVALEIPFDEIESLDITEDFLNYIIHINTADSQITLSTQQKELSDFRSAGVLTYSQKGNWHKDNFDSTIAALKTLSK